MKPCFVDTSFVLALTLADDQYHERAVLWNRRAAAPRITTEYILVEIADALCQVHLRAVAARTISLMRGASMLEIIPASTSLMDLGLDLYRARQDKRWSLTDCISFVVMTEKGLTDALSSDHGFEQAGFTAMLCQNPSASARKEAE